MSSRNHQPSAISHRPSAIGHQPSAIGQQPSAIRYRLFVSGVVQGVGFRPFVYGLATRLGLKGWVRNTSAGVTIEIEGWPDAVNEFQAALTRDAPPLARIDRVTAAPLTPDGFTRFEIRESVPEPGAFQPISPDISICPDCLRELFDPADRRYLYPFINCTNCGPRFTIIKDIPYDRPKTTMAPFEMCPECAWEYHDPLNRRFHAQPVACAVCGPRIWLEFSDQRSVTSHQSAIRNSQFAIEEARRLLARGNAVAVKGLGGFHLACDATNEEAVAELRRRKGRVDKPFALMMADMATVERYCCVSPEERALLESRERPIVLLWKRESDTPPRMQDTPSRLQGAPTTPVNGDGPFPPISLSVAPGQRTLGVMLPYTPLHYLLFTDALHPSSFILPPLVMTSGNYSEEPIAHLNDDALARLAPLADAFLLHDRDIHIRTDDSVVRVVSHQSSVISEQLSVNSDQAMNTDHRSLTTDHCTLPIRRSRGYAPFPVKLPFSVPPILAVGGELKNTFCVARERYAFMSHHVGDMENLETLQSFEAGVAHFERLFRIAPEIIAHDLHPDYLSTRFAIRNSQPATRIPVQHHHAHVAACLAENGLDGARPVIGVAFDGTGFGTDGAIWGGELLLTTYRSFERVAHLAYVPLPGGDAGTRKPARVALSHLIAAGLPLDPDLPPVRALSAAERRIIEKQVASGLNSPPTSSMGRLFDAVASLIGVRQEVNYEGQAAIELEAIADEGEGEVYEFEVRETNFQRIGNGKADTTRSPSAFPLNHPLEVKPLTVSAAPVIRAVVADFRAGVPAPTISARFHNGVAATIRDICLRIREERGLSEVALSGGVFQNVTLLGKALSLLREAGFKVFTHRLVPPNDGGIALGQAIVAASRLPLTDY